MDRLEATAMKHSSDYPGIRSGWSGNATAQVHWGIQRSYIMQVGRSNELRGYEYWVWYYYTTDYR